MRTLPERFVSWRRLDVGKREYPRIVAETQDPPASLWMRGSPPPHDGGIAIIGSRDVTDAGAARAAAVARIAVEYGIPVISGLAAGVDAIAHKETVSLRGCPVGVIATGVDGPYTPASTRVLHESVAESGTLLSPFPIGHEPTRTSFLERNAVIAALSRVVFVADATQVSGTRNAVNHAVRLGRVIVLPAVLARSVPWAQRLAKERPKVTVAHSLDGVRAALSRVIE